MEYTEKEAAIIDEMKALIMKSTAGLVSADQLNDKLKDIKGEVTAEQLKALTDAVEAQGLEIQKMNESRVPQYKTIHQQLMEQMKGKTKEDLRKGIDLQVNLDLVPNRKGVGTISVGSQSYLPFPTLDPGWGYQPNDLPILRRISDVGTTPTGRVVYIRLGAKEGSVTTDGVAEGAAKDQIDFTPTAVNADAVKFAGYVKYTEEAMDDIPSFMTELERELTEQINEAEDSGMLTLLTGTIANAYTLTGILTDNPNNYDAILAMATQVRTYNFEPNAAIINPQDYATMLLSKADTGGSYMLPPFAASNLLTIGGVTLYPSNQITAGNALVGDFSKFHIRDYKGMTLRIGFSGTDFLSNIITCIGERRTVYYSKGTTNLEEWNAFVYDDFAGVISAITGS